MNRSYVVGFLFHCDTFRGFRVALIEKSKPDWQRGKLNGVGGKIELGESPAEAMVREFKEETGQLVTGWRKFCTLYAPGARIVFFVAHVNGELEFTPEPGEPVNWYYARDVCEMKIIPNLRWLIPMALDENHPLAVIHEQGQEFPLTRRP